MNHSLGYQKTHSLISIYGTFSVSQALYQVGAGPMEIPKILLSGSTWSHGRQTLCNMLKFWTKHQGGGGKKCCSKKRWWVGILPSGQREKKKIQIKQRQGGRKRHWCSHRTGHKVRYRVKERQGVTMTPAWDTRAKTPVVHDSDNRCARPRPKQVHRSSHFTWGLKDKPSK